MFTLEIKNKISFFFLLLIIITIIAVVVVVIILRSRLFYWPRRKCGQDTRGERAYRGMKCGSRIMTATHNNITIGPRHIY